MLNVTPTLILILILILILTLPPKKQSLYPLSNFLLSEISSQEQLSPVQMLDYRERGYTLLPR